MTLLRASSLVLAGLSLQLPAPLQAQSGGKIEFFESTPSGSRPRTGYRLTSLGAKVSVSARVVDAGRRPVPNRPIAYRTADPNIAIVSPQGVVQSRRVGRTRVWAVSGTDSSFALVVVDQWASKFAFSPSPVAFDAIGGQVALDVQLRDASGNVIPSVGRRTSQCRPRDDRIVQLDANGRVQAKANGLTWIRCSDRGIADSVRVEVRQRPARAMIVDKLQIGTKSIPDTFRLRMRAFDPKGDSIPNVRATWASLNANMVTINPVTGLAQAIGPGTARIVTQIADATDTLTVTITGTALASAVDASAPAVDLTRQPTLTIEAPSLAVGDTIRLTLRAQDAAGVAIANPEINTKITSTDSTVAKYIGNQKVVATGTGVAMILARLDVNGLQVRESLTVRPRPRGNAASTTASTAPDKVGEFKRPEKNIDSARVANADRIRTLMKAIVDSGIGKTTSGRTVQGEAVASLAKHYTRISPSASEARSGIMFGGIATGTPLRKLALSSSYKTGTLAVKSGAGEEMSVTEVDGQLMLWPVRWLGVGGGYMLRGERTDLSLATWTAANITTQLRWKFVGDAVTTMIGASIFPYSKFSGDTVPPQVSSLAGEAGIDVRLGAFVGGFRYYVENFTFPKEAVTGDQRTDQFSTLRIRLGLKFGR